MRKIVCQRQGSRVNKLSPSMIKGVFGMEIWESLIGENFVGFGLYFNIYIWDVKKFKK